jgi:hypothetical protein
MTTFDDTTASSLDQEEQDQQEHDERPQLFYRAIRFKNGEEVVCAVMQDDLDWTIKKFVLINDPYIVNPDGSLRPWSLITDQYQIPMATDTMQAMYFVQESIEERYEDAVEEAYMQSLRNDLKNPKLTDEERESLERELFAASDGSDPIDVAEPPEMFGNLPVSKTLH